MAAWIRAGSVRLEAHEHFVKQTYRNRTSIYGANGKLDLILPVDHRDLYSKPIQQVQLAAGHSWKNIHWRSIESAYRNSPYFDYYEAELKAVFDRPERFLFQWNLNMLRKISELLEFNFNPVITTEYISQYPDEVTDLRKRFLPKHSPAGDFPVYSQVFMTGHGFISNLSVLDLLFNLGKESNSYLLRLGDIT